MLYYVMLYTISYWLKFWALGQIDMALNLSYATFYLFNFEKVAAFCEFEMLHL